MTIFTITFLMNRLCPFQVKVVSWNGSFCFTNSPKDGRKEANTHILEAGTSKYLSFFACWINCTLNVCNIFVYWLIIPALVDIMSNILRSWDWSTQLMFPSCYLFTLSQLRCVIVYLWYMIGRLSSHSRIKSPWQLLFFAPGRYRQVKP